MHLNAKRPVFVPAQYCGEIEKLSKAALMDMVWDYAAQNAGTEQDGEAVMKEFRARREIIQHHRNNS